MDTTLDLSRWRAVPYGVAYRRWSMISTGLRLLLKTKIFKAVVLIGWGAGLLIAVAGFVFSQAVASGGWLETLAAKLGPRMEAIVAALGGFVSLYPDICVRGVFTVIFWIHSYIGLLLTLVALTVMIPRLITRDRASNALTIYLSRPLTTADYLLGKLGMIVGTIFLVWTAPLLFGWLVSMLFAVDRDFVVYSIEPLSRALVFNAIALGTLSAIALGVSAVGRTARTTSVLWAVLWLVLGSISSPPGAPTWVRRASFSQDLSQIRQEVFRLDTALTEASQKLPLLSRNFSTSLERAGQKAEARDFPGALMGLGALVVLSSAVFFQKLKPE